MEFIFLNDSSINCHFLADRQLAMVRPSRATTSKSTLVPPPRTPRPPKSDREPSPPDTDAPGLWRTVSAKSKTIKKAKKSAKENVVPKESAVMMAQMAR